MKGYLRRAAAAAVVAGGVGAAGCASTGTTARGGAPDGCGFGGCAAGACADGHAHGGWLGDCYRTWVDPCWPERYSAAARASVLVPFAAQVNNGHVLNQTIWNWYFEPGTDRLTPAGAAKLDSIARTRPAPDPRLYLQVARDVAVTPDTLDTVGAKRDDLTARRAAVVRKYMAAQPAIERMAYEVFVHDAIEPGIPSEFARTAYRAQGQGYRGGIGGAGGTNATSVGAGGPTPAASGIGTGPNGAPVGGPSSGPGVPEGPTAPTPGPGPEPAPNGIPNGGAVYVPVVPNVP